MHIHTLHICYDILRCHPKNLCAWRCDFGRRLNDKGAIADLLLEVGHWGRTHRKDMAPFLAPPSSLSASRSPQHEQHPSGETLLPRHCCVSVC